MYHESSSLERSIVLKKFTIMKTKLILFSFIIVLGTTNCTYRLAFGGCAYRVKTGECYQETIHDADITLENYTAADHLMRHALMILRPEHRLLVTTIADIDNLEDSTSLGRLLTEHLAARFAQKGYTVKEVKLHPGLILIPRTGEFILSREVGDVHADVVIAGTYAVGRNLVYITLKMLECKSGNVISSYAYTLPLGPNTLALLEKTWVWW